MTGIAVVGSNAEGPRLDNFHDVTVFRLGIKEEGVYVIFGRVSISNDDGDPQNASARVTHDDGAFLVDRADVRIPGNGRIAVSVQGTLRVDPGKPKIMEFRCSTFKGSVSQLSLFAIQVTDLKFN